MVYRAHHLTLGTPHAIKVVRDTDPAVRARLLQEGRLQATLRHPNIVGVTDTIDLDGQPGLVMEYVPGPTLARVLLDGPLTPAEVDALARGMLAGVAHAHRHGLVHRDLKPQNILLHAVADGVVAKVTDFGIAKVLAERGAGLTATGQAVGTPGYMAPEQVRSSRDVDARADVFALGAVLYEMLAGHGPFHHPDPFVVFQRVATGEWTPLPEGAGIEPRMVEAIGATLRPDPAARPLDAGALADLWTAGAPPPDPSTLAALMARVRAAPGPEGHSTPVGPARLPVHASGRARAPTDGREPSGDAGLPASEIPADGREPFGDAGLPASGAPADGREPSGDAGLPASGIPPMGSSRPRVTEATWRWLSPGARWAVPALLMVLAGLPAAWIWGARGELQAPPPSHPSVTNPVRASGPARAREPMGATAPEPPAAPSVPTPRAGELERPVPPPATRAPPTEPEPPREAAQALRVSTRPVASVQARLGELEGSRAGRAWSFAVAPGEHELYLVGADGRTARTTITVPIAGGAFCWDYDRAAPCE